MADRYWVGGAGTWSSANTANWSVTSGGASGASVPGSADAVYFDSNSGSGVVTFTNGGVTIGNFSLNASAITLSLNAAFSIGSGGFGDLGVVAGTFTTNNYAVTSASMGNNGSGAGTINLGSSTLTINGIFFGITFSGTPPTFNAGTSQINITSANQRIVASGLTFYDVSFTNGSLGNSIDGSNTFRNLSLAGRTTAGVSTFDVTGNQTITGTLTLSAGTDATMRTFLKSATVGTNVTLTCAAVAAPTDIDFRDITIAGAAAPVSGTRLGDCKGNSGITFGAGVNKYWNLAGNNNWSATAWATSAGGAVSVNNFPLAQDTAIFTSTSPATGATTTVNTAYNIGTVDMSARTTNTMTLATGACTIYGNWVNGTGTTLSGNVTLTFAGRTSQTITSAGRTFTQGFSIDTPSGSVTLLDAFATSRSATSALTVNQGTFDANGYAVTLSGASSGFGSSNSNVRTVALGSGTWTVAGTGSAVWSTSTSTNLTLTGTGTISLTSASAKTFAGGGVQTYPTLNQGGTGTLTISGSNKFADLTSTTIGGILFTGGTTNVFGAFSINGSSGNLLQLSSTNTTQAILKKPTAWNVGANSTNSGNNTGLSFTAGGNDYLNVSYIIGQSAGGNFLMFF